MSGRKAPSKSSEVANFEKRAKERMQKIKIAHMNELLNVGVAAAMRRGQYTRNYDECRTC